MYVRRYIIQCTHCNLINLLESSHGNPDCYESRWENSFPSLGINKWNSNSEIVDSYCPNHDNTKIRRCDMVNIYDMSMSL